MKPQSSTRHTPGATAIVEEEALLRQWSIEAPSGSPRKITQVVRSWVIHLCRRLSSTDRNPSRYLLQNSTGCSLRRLVRRCRGKRVKDSIKTPHTLTTIQASMHWLFFREWENIIGKPRHRTKSVPPSLYIPCRSAIFVWVWDRRVLYQKPPNRT